MLTMLGLLIDPSLSVGDPISCCDWAEETPEELASVEMECFVSPPEIVARLTIL